MNIESVRAVATSTERSGQPERKASATRVSAYDPSTAQTASTGLTAVKRVTAVEKTNASAATDTAAVSTRTPDSTAFSKPAQMLGKLRQVADADPSALSGLLSDGAAQIQSAVTDNAVQDPERMLAIAQNFQAAAQSQSVADLDPTKLQGSTPADNQLATALLARADAVLGIAPAPYGPWFPRF